MALGLKGKEISLTEFKRNLGELIAADDTAYITSSNRDIVNNRNLERDYYSEEDVKRNFDRVLKAVQENAHAQARKWTGTVQRVLIESINEQDESLVTGRMSNNTLVHFKGDKTRIGTFADVHLDECRGFYYMGTEVGGV